MTSDSFRSFVALPVASVFLILILCLFAIDKPPATGLRVPVTHVRTFPFSDCYDDRSVWVIVSKDGGVRINETAVPRNELKLRISQIYENRQESNATFMLIDPDVPYGDFLEIYDQVSSANRSLHVGVITDGVMKALKSCPMGASCGLDWPDHKYIPWCLYFNHPLVQKPHQGGE